MPGINDRNGDPYSPVAVRIGRKEKVDPSVRAVLLDTLVENAHKSPSAMPPGNRHDGVKGAIWKGADVVCTRFSGLGAPWLLRLLAAGFFETVIIDEAAQCVEASSLIPLQHD